MPRHALLNSQEHASLRVRTGAGGALGDAVMSCLTVPSEFRQVQAEYPILFRRNIERDEFVALALLGFETGENLFVEGGRWDAAYRPLASAVQPFLIGRAAPDSDDRQVHIDLDSPRVNGSEGERLFDNQGRPTPFLEAAAERLGALDAGYQASAGFFAALRRYELLEPLTLDVTLDDGSAHRLVGFHVIDEDRLRGLDEAALGDLHRDGWLMPVFMAVASLGRLTTLIARKNARLRHA